MNPILTFFTVVELFGFATGILLVAPAQAVLALGESSQSLGMMGAGQPIGYALSCLAFGQLFRKFPGKYVVLCGIVCASAACVSMPFLTSGSAYAVAQLLFGLSAGAFWPFTSAWMLDFANDKLGKTRILRFYNVAWTSGTAAGLLAGGFLCKNNLLTTSFYVAEGALILAFVIALFPPATRNTLAPDASSPAGRPRLGVPLLLAAVIATLATIATRTVMAVNYAELNRFLNFEADRMGILTAATLCGQLLAFMCGSIYEPLLGLRRLYVLVAVALVSINVVFAYATSMPLLILAAVILGAMAAIAFQAGIIAAVECFSSPRTGTTFHEAVVGFGGVASYLAGIVVELARRNGVAEPASLRAPFLAMAAVIVVGLLVQCVLISMRSKERVLLPPSVVPTA